MNNSDSTLEPEVAADAHKAELPLQENQRSQISDGHRLIQLAGSARHSLYARSEFLRRAVYVSAEDWVDSFIATLRMKMSRNVALRTNATLDRARKKMSDYRVTALGPAELIAETLFDSTWFRKSEEYHSRSTVRDSIVDLLARRAPIELVFPILSRKPTSPLKNRGALPDLAEIVSLARLAEAAQVINTFSPTGCILTLAADGHKYRRGCGTPSWMVDEYQASLRYWIQILGVNSLLKLSDYETLARETLSDEEWQSREAAYLKRTKRLSERYDPMFFADSVLPSLEIVSAIDDLGKQLAYTFRSMLTSVHYTWMEGCTETSVSRPYLGDDEQALYVDHVANLHNPLSDFSKPWAFLNRKTPGTAIRNTEIFRDMRLEAWRAAIRYVAISLVDRELNVLRRCRPDALKLTIHAKPQEFHFVAAPRRNVNMTAQHCTGGFDVENDEVKMDFCYRIQRESDSQTPILISRESGAHAHHGSSGPLLRMSMLEQPIAYVNDADKLFKFGFAATISEGLVL